MEELLFSNCDDVDRLCLSDDEMNAAIDYIQGDWCE
jgi:hypothetical protein